jgi:hypothetical protein
VEILGFLACAHQEVFIHFGVLTPNIGSLLFGKVRDVARVHLDGFLDGRVLFEVLGWDMRYFGHLAATAVFVLGTLLVLCRHPDLLAALRPAPLYLVRLL